MKYTIALMMVVLLPNCGSSVLKLGDKESYEQSSLYDPPTIHLKLGQIYQFEEGQLEGRGQKFHSDASYRDAVILK
jgi:hypothetical protein